MSLGNRQKGDEAIAIKEDQAIVIVPRLEAVEKEAVLVYKAKASSSGHA